jgi:hypothetical protein
MEVVSKSTKGFFVFLCVLCELGAKISLLTQASQSTQSFFETVSS